VQREDFPRLMSESVADLSARASPTKTLQRRAFQEGFRDMAAMGSKVLKASQPACTQVPACLKYNVHQQ